jgi:outer membrane protein assembly factor BamB
MKSCHTTLVTVSCIYLMLVVACNNGAYTLESQNLTSTCTQDGVSSLGVSTINWSHTFNGGIAGISRNFSSVAVIVREVVPATVTTSVSPPEIRESLVILRASDGQFLWQYPSDTNAIKPNVIRGISINDKYVAIFFQLPNPKVVVFLAGTGEPVFEMETDTLEVLLAGDNLFFRDETRTLLGYDLISGDLLFKQPPGDGRGERGIIYDGGNRIYSLFNGNVYTFNAHTGVLENNFPVTFAGGNGFYFEGAISGHYLLGAVGNEIVYYNLDTGVKVWHSVLANSNGIETKTTRDLWPPAFMENSAFLTADNYKIYQISLADGLVSPLALPLDDDRAITTPIVLGDHLYSIFADRMLKTLDLNNGQWANLLESETLRYPGNSSGFNFYYPIISALDSNNLLVSFGCQELYAVSP